MLKTINFSEFDSLKPNDPKVKSLLNLLGTEVAEGVFYKEQDTPNIQLYEKLKKQGQVKNRNQSLVVVVNGVERNSSKQFVYENILQAISFVVSKLELLRKLSQLSDDEQVIVKSLNIKTRLININQRLLMIKSVMDKMDEVKEIAAWAKSKGLQTTIYTGHTIDELFKKRKLNVFSPFDYVIDGAFDCKQKERLPFRGSRNQKIWKHLHDGSYKNVDFDDNGNEINEDVVRIR